MRKTLSRYLGEIVVLCIVGAFFTTVLVTAAQSPIISEVSALRYSIVIDMLAQHPQQLSGEIIKAMANDRISEDEYSALQLADEQLDREDYKKSLRKKLAELQKTEADSE